MQSDSKFISSNTFVRFFKEREKKIIEAGFGLWNRSIVPSVFFCNFATTGRFALCKRNVAARKECRTRGIRVFNFFTKYHNVFPN